MLEKHIKMAFIELICYMENFLFELFIRFFYLNMRSLDIMNTYFINTEIHERIRNQRKKWNFLIWILDEIFFWNRLKIYIFKQLFFELLDLLHLYLDIEIIRCLFLLIIMKDWKCILVRVLFLIVLINFILKQIIDVFVTIFLNDLEEPLNY